MRLTLLTDIGLRVLMYLAVYEGRMCTVEEMVRNCLTRRELTVKAVQKLRIAGYIRSRRGRGGGFGLARKPEQITAGEIMRLLEPDFALAECFRLGCRAKCAIVGNCILQKELTAALHGFLAHMDRVSIRQLTDNRLVIMSLNKRFQDVPRT